MRVCLKECKDAELVRSSVPIARENDMYENTQPEIENCSDGIAPQPNTAVDGSQKMIAPVVVSMTKYLFAHYRLQMYAYLNNSLRSGMLERIVGFSFTNRTINREVCTFKGVNYWRMDRMNRAPRLRLSPINCRQPERVKSTCACFLMPCSLLVNIKMTSHSILKRQRTA